MPADRQSADVQAALVGSSSVFASNAVGAYLEEQYEVFLMHAATAGEHLLKASLCGRSAALIAEAIRDGDRHFRSLCALLGIDVPAHKGGGRHDQRRPSRSIRTIGAEEALRRVGAFLPELSGGRDRDGLSELFALRNGVVHLGDAAARSDAVRLRLPFVAACELLLTDIGQDAQRFWGWANSQIAARWGQEAREEAEQVVEDKLDAARRRYSVTSDVIHHARVYEDVHDDLTYTHEPLESAIADCPACGMPCIASGLPELAPAGGEADAELQLTSLSCKVCGLQLWGPAELAFAGVPRAVALPGVSATDVDEFYAQE